MDMDHGHLNSTYFDPAGRGAAHRLLAPAGGAPTVDYAVIAFLVITLGLVLGIEVLRHQLDVAASGNKFFQTVLELMYQELTTLGIVEFCIYLMHKHHKDFNYQMEVVFVDVHFMLFFTAVVNAIQSCLVRLMAGYRTDKSWVKGEDIDVHHYIGIRKEFDRLENIFKRSDSSARPPSCWKRFHDATHDLAFKIAHPRLARRKSDLLSILHFHQLRAHFIESNSLPQKFPVSGYLKRSLMGVLLDFVHISSAAWIMLMATANLLYFLAGMILSVSGESVKVEKFLLYTFFALVVLFLALAVVLFFKMKHIFSQMLHVKLAKGDERESERSWRGALAKEGRSADQRKLFWGGSPHLIIVAIQFMQFGYALAISMMLIYYKEFAKLYSVRHPNWLIFAILLSYLIFLYLVSVIIPWYTLCTSMGEMVNKERFLETLAKLKLGEEIRKKESLEEERKAEEEIARRKREIEAAKAAARASNASKTSAKEARGSEQKGSPGMLSILRSKSIDVLDSGPMMSIFRNRSVDALDWPDGSSGLNSSEQRKTSTGGFSNKSNGASELRLSGNLDTIEERTGRGVDPVEGGEGRSRNRRLSAAAALQLDTVDDDEREMDGSKFIIKEGPSSQFQSRSGRRRLTKSMSENVALMRMMNSTDPSGLAKESVQREDPASTPKAHSTLDQNVFCSSSKEIASHARPSPSPRSNATDALLIPSIEEKDVISEAEDGDEDVTHSGDLAPSDEGGGDPPSPSAIRGGGGGEAFLSSPSTVPSDEGGGDPPSPSAIRGGGGGEVFISSPSTSSGGDKNMSAASSLSGGENAGPTLQGTASSGGEFHHIDALFTAAESPLDDVLAVINVETKKVTGDDEETEADVTVTPVEDAARSGDLAPSDGGGGDKDFTHIGDVVLPGKRTAESKEPEELPKSEHAHVSTKDLPDIPDSQKIQERKQRRRTMKARSEGVMFMRSSLSNESPRLSLETAKMKEPENLRDLSEIAQVSSEDLPLRTQSRPRANSASEGVSSMSSDVVMKESADGAGLASPERFVDENRDINEDTVTELSELSLGRHERKERRRRMRAQSEGVASMRSSLPNMSLMRSVGPEAKEPERMVSLSELAQVSTKDLPGIPDFSPSAIPARRSRRKSTSAGVSIMRAGPTIDGPKVKELEKLPSLSQLAQISTKDLPDVPDSQKVRQERKQRRRTMKARSEGVGFMRSSLPNEMLRPVLETGIAKEPENLQDLSEIAQASTKESPLATQSQPRANSASKGVTLMSSDVAMKESADGTELASSEGSVDKHRGSNEDTVTELSELSLARHERKERRRRMRAQSEGVASMRSSLPNMPFMQSPDPEDAKGPGRMETLSELAQVTTKDIPEFPPSAIPARRSRRRSTSAGVSIMAAGPTSDRPIVKEPEELPSLSVLAQISTEDLPAVSPEELPGVQNFSASARPARRPRMRSASAGVSIMRAGLTSDRPKVKERQTLPALSELAQNSTKENMDFPTSPRVGSKWQTRAKSEGLSLTSSGLLGYATSNGAINVLDKDTELASSGRLIDDNHGTNEDILTDVLGLSLRKNERKERRRRMKAQSEGVAMMRSSLPNMPLTPILDTEEAKGTESVATMSDRSQISTKDSSEIGDFLASVRPARGPRGRSTSAGMSIMAAGLTSDTGMNALRKIAADAVVANTAKDSSMACGGNTKNKVEFLLAQPEEPSFDIKDIVSAESAAGDDSEESDVEEEALLSYEKTIRNQSKMQVIARKIDLAAFFQGSRYRTISLVFGPMLCLFFIAMRVEIFNIYAGIFVDQTNFVKNMLVPSFWVELALYCAMIAEMLSVVLVFWMKKGREGVMFSCSAAVFGLLINSMCLILLLFAETKRCCPDNDYVSARLLGPAPSEGYYDDPAAEEVECCPKFGARRYGGLGTIEPFTFLVALSPLRFFVAGRVVKLFHGGAGKNDKDHLHSEMAAHGHHGPDPTSKVRYLWLTAIGMHGDVAKSFGIFSGELLQCMLGIYSPETDIKELEASTGDPNCSDTNDANVLSSEIGSSKHSERANSLEITSNDSGRGFMSPLISPAISRDEFDDFGLSSDDFQYPRARLIRRMRRCERRLPPLFDDWIQVDVVLTNHELIIFDVPNETEAPESWTLENAVSNHNNGGKGLRLQDVAKGRKTLSQFNLDDIDFVHIEHRDSIPGHVEDDDIEANHNHLLEYWQGGNVFQDVNLDAMDKRWAQVDEDRLKIHFKYITLYLRFMADLKEMEHKSKTAVDETGLMNHVGTQTQVWCQTIARLRGPTNLKQNLPHFGDGGTNEVRDFVVCEKDHEHGHRNANKVRRSLNRHMSLPII